jgi:hypothetical protein
LPLEKQLGTGLSVLLDMHLATTPLLVHVMLLLSKQGSTVTISSCVLIRAMASPP